MCCQARKIISFIEPSSGPVNKTGDAMTTLIHSRLFPSHVCIKAVENSRGQFTLRNTIGGAIICHENENGILGKPQIFEVFS